MYYDYCEWQQPIFAIGGKFLTCWFQFQLQVVKKDPSVVNELETCAAFVPQELSKGNLNDAKTLELGAIIKKAHVLDSEKPTAQEYMDVSSNSLTENTLFYLEFFFFFFGFLLVL